MTLREMREARGMTQTELARLMDAEQPTVSYWESGKNAPVRKRRGRLAAALGVSLDELESTLAEGRAPKC